MACGPKVRHLRVGDVVTRMVNRATLDLRVHWGGYAERGLVQDWRAMQEDGVTPGFSPGFYQVLPPDFDAAASTRIADDGTGGNALSFANHAANLLAGFAAGAGRVAAGGGSGWSGTPPCRADLRQQRNRPAGSGPVAGAGRESSGATTFVLDF